LQDCRIHHIVEEGKNEREVLGRGTSQGEKTLNRSHVLPVPSAKSEGEKTAEKRKRDARSKTAKKRWVSGKDDF